MSEKPRAAAPHGLILVIEAATAAGSLALLSHTPNRAERDAASHDAAAHNRSSSTGLWRVVATRSVPMGSGRHDVLTPAIASLLEDAELTPHALAAVVCGAGPGSFTSLRIAASTAKGLVWGTSTPLYGVPSMLLAAWPATGSTGQGAYLCSMDALRAERYAQAVDVHADGTVLAVGPMHRVPEGALEAAADGRTLLTVSADHPPQADRVQWLADWNAYGPVDVDTWEPGYGRLAEAQVKWEASHGQALPAV